MVSLYNIVLGGLILANVILNVVDWNGSALLGWICAMCILLRVIGLECEE